MLLTPPCESFVVYPQYLLSELRRRDLPTQSRVPLGVGGGGGATCSNYARMCVSKSERHGSFFQLQGSEMSENISLNMGVIFAASLNVGKNLC